MPAGSHIVVMSLDEQRYGLPLAVVDRVVRRVAVTPLPSAPAIVLGIVNIRGRVIPVVDLRRRFRLPPREATLSDVLVLARTDTRSVGLIVDSVNGVAAIPDDASVAAGTILGRTEHVTSVVKQQDGLTLISDLTRFLSLDEHAELDQALSEQEAAP